MVTSLLIPREEECAWFKPPTQQGVTEKPATKTARTSAPKPDILNLNLDRLKHHYEKVGVKVMKRTNTAKELEMYYKLRRALLNRGVGPDLLDALVMQS